MKKTNITLLIITLFITGCASLTPTRETTEGYKVYDIKDSSNVSSMVNNLKSAIQKNAGKARFTNDIPPYPLPKTPGRFKMVSPFARNSNISAYMSAHGKSMKLPSCEQSIFSATSNDDFMGTENTTFFVCLLPYEGGHHMNIYYKFTKVSGGVSTQALGNAMAESMMGDSSQFIPRTIKAMEKAVKDSGGTLKLVESYP